MSVIGGVSVWTRSPGPGRELLAVGNNHRRNTLEEKLR